MTLSVCLAVTAAGRGSFTAAVEVKQQRQLIVSFLYHMAVQRNVKNPFETTDVMGEAAGFLPMHAHALSNTTLWTKTEVAEMERDRS